MLAASDPLPCVPRRVLVAGPSGSGKTTLARRIAAVTGAPHTEIDSLFHGPGWSVRPDFVPNVEAIMAQESWVSEWQYGQVRSRMAAEADLLVWLDLPYWTVTLPRVLSRTVRRRLKREHLWNSNYEAPLWTFFTDRDHIVRWSIRTRHDSAPQVAAAESEHPNLTVVRLGSRQDVATWVNGPLTTART